MFNRSRSEISSRKPAPNKRLLKFRRNDSTHPCNYCHCSKVHDKVKSRSGYISTTAPPSEKDDMVFYAKCEICGSYICSRCMHKMWLRASKKAKENDPWLQQIRRVYTTGPHLEVPMIMGACCEHKQELSLARAADDTMTLYHRLWELSSSDVSLIDGMLFLPQLALFIDSPNDCTDIHGFGKMAGVYEGLAHLVPDLETVVRAGNKGIYPRPFSSHPAYKDRVTVFIPDYDWTGNFDTTGKMVSAQQRASRVPRASRALSFLFYYRPA